MTHSLLKCIKILCAAAGLYLLFVALFSSSVADNDLWGYLSFGRIFWEDGYFPYSDPFAYTPVKPLWVYHEWLTGVSFYFIYKHAGAAGLQLLRYVIVLVTLYLMYLTAIRRGGSPSAACIALVPAMLLITFGYVPVRAQIFTYLFFILTVYILERFKQGAPWSLLAWLLPIHVIWCNFHGGFVAGLGLIFLYTIGECLSGRRYIPIAVAGVLAAMVTVINPYGLHYWNYTMDAVFMSRPEIDEWISVPSSIRLNLYGVPIFIFSVMSIVCLVACLLRRKRNYTDILVTAVIIYIGIRHVRHSVFMGLIFGTYLPVVLSGFWNAMKEANGFPRRYPWFPGAAFAILLVAVFLAVNPSRGCSFVPTFGIVTPSSGFPVDAVKWIIKNNIKGNILSYFDWGEFLIWYGYPSCRIAMDGRYETVYEEHVHREYFDFLVGRPTWKIFLQKYPHDMILIKANSRTHELLRHTEGWRVVYSDRESVLFMKDR